MQVGIISDTHGLMRPEALTALRGCELILHAGDIGRSAILEALRAIAPVTAIRGNVDRQGWAAGLPRTDLVEADGRALYLVHDVNDLDLDPAAVGVCAVISGHSHRPEIRWRKGILYLNPGSAGPRRFRLPVTLARLEMSDGRLAPELVSLD